jgi:hypothetical protein
MLGGQTPIRGGRQPAFLHQLQQPHFISEEHGDGRHLRPGWSVLNAVPVVRFRQLDGLPQQCASILNLELEIDRQHGRARADQSADQAKGTGDPGEVAFGHWSSALSNALEASPNAGLIRGRSRAGSFFLR